MAFNDGTVYTTSSSTSSTIWTPWDDWNATNGTTTISGKIWDTWTSASDTSSTSGTWGGWTVYHDPGVQIHEPRTVMRYHEAVSRGAPEANEATRKRMAADAARKAAAVQRATELLIAHLDEEQLKEFHDRRAFHLIGQDGKRYEIDCTNRMHNVFEKAGDRRARELCIFQYGYLPLPDNALAQKLLLEADAQRFREIANITQMRA